MTKKNKRGLLAIACAVGVVFILKNMPEPGYTAHRRARSGAILLLVGAMFFTHRYFKGGPDDGFNW